MSKTRANVYFNNVPAGVLEKDADGYTFTYDNDYLEKDGARPLSLTLPLAQKRFHSGGLFPFFKNLIPEGWLLELNARTLKIDTNDEFGLLLATGADCVGAVSVVPMKKDDV